MKVQARTTFAASLALALLLPVIGAAQDRDDDIDDSPPVEDSTEADDSVDGDSAFDDDSAVDDRDVDDRDVDDRDVDDRDVDGRDADARDVDGVEGSEADDGSGFPVTVTDYSDDNPTPPSAPRVNEMGESGSVEVAQDAGVGSPLAYARATVLELGGAIGFRHQSVTTSFSLSPSLGYFIVDGLQLTLFARFDLTHISGGDEPTDQSQTDVAFATLLEPSYHLAITEAFYVFAGAGVGATFSRDPVADFLFRPRVGVDLLVGRSAIFKPAVYVDIGAVDGFTGVGVEGAFTAIW